MTTSPSQENHMPDLAAANPWTEPRLWSKVDPEGDCWMWLAGRNRDGYGRFGNLLAHRVVYEALVGPIPPGLEPDHLCRVPACVNPDHLELVTHRENMRRSMAGTLNQRRLLARTHCKRGHALVGPNLYRTPDGRRQCRACPRLRPSGG